MYGSILSKPRRYITNRSPAIDHMLKCSLCTGFWSGIIISVIAFFITPVVELVFLPLASCAMCWLYDSIIGLVHAQTESIDHYKKK